MTTQLHQQSSKSIATAGQLLNAALFAFDQASQEDAARKTARPFITVSRQPGAGAILFSHRLAERLNRSGAQDWSAWDRELVEKVSAEHGIARDIVEMIPNRRHNWLSDIFESFAVSHTPAEISEARAYKRVVMTIRALASAGHAILVGRGGIYITQEMPGAIHLRLVAPLEHRIRHVVERDKISIHEAAARINEIERQREDFYRHYWPGHALRPENYTLTLNSASLSVDEMIECVLPVIRARESCRNCPRCAKEKCTRAESAAAPVVEVASAPVQSV